MKWIDWRELEANIPLEILPQFHRDFLVARGLEDTQSTKLRRIQQNVERELNTMLRDGTAKEDNQLLLVSSQSIPEAWHNYANVQKT